MFYLDVLCSNFYSMTVENASRLLFPLQTMAGRGPKSNILQEMTLSSMLDAYFMESYIYNINNFWHIKMQDDFHIMP